MANESQKIIYTVMGVSKYHDKRAILKDISLSYFYGAKIGVIGLNGSGKSSLLRIMAGVDREFNGQTIPELPQIKCYPFDQTKGIVDS
jgi:ATPase subunit of ABC transporter with duplicated ATPase domains